MRTFDTLLRVADTDPVPARQLIAAVIKQAAEHRAWGPTKVARASGIAVNTLYRALAAEPSVSRLSLRQLERGLDLPDELLLLIDSGSVGDVAAIPADDWPSQRMRTLVLTEMGWEPPRGRGSQARRRA